MSIDVSHIIRHGFRKVDDISAIKDFVFQTIEQLKEKAQSKIIRKNN